MLKPIYSTSLVEPFDFFLRLEEVASRFLQKIEDTEQYDYGQHYLCP